MNQELLVGLLLTVLSCALYLFKAYMQERQAKTEIQLLPFLMDHLVEFAEGKHGSGNGNEKMKTVVTLASSVLKSVPADQAELFAEKSVANMNRILALLESDEEEEVECEEEEVEYEDTVDYSPVYSS